MIPLISSAQLGFCPGSKGDPIFHEDFGSGTGTGPALAAGRTSYRYVTGDPQDGEYTISSNIGNIINSWHSYLPATTLSNGRALIVNADYTSGQFYRTTASGLCENTSYEFSAYLMNIYNASNQNCPNGGIPVNVRFEIWDETDTQLLKEGNTGDIASTSSPKWEQYALTFQSRPGQNAVILKMFNNGNGGCGNDLAIDDIVFASCGDLTTLQSDTGTAEVVVCPDEAPVSVELNATPDSSVYSSHYYQWQQSNDGESWSDINGATTDVYITPLLASTAYFRVKVAEDPVNLSSNLCSSASEAYRVKIVETPMPPVSNGDQAICGDENIPALSVNVAGDETVDWFDAPAGGNLMAEGTTSFSPENEGTYYAEARKKDYECAGSTRTAVTLTINGRPEVADETLQICPGSSIVLDAGIPGLAYIWSVGETSQDISVSSAGEYEVTLITPQGCEAVKHFTVSGVDEAGIEEVISRGTTVEIVSQFEGVFEYSLDGINFQSSNVFRNIPGGIYTAYMRDTQSCSTVSRKFPHIVIPDFITPNGDGYNDVFSLNGLSYFSASEIRIFDRYGKLLKAGNGEGFVWDGTFNNKDLPASDYWYYIFIEDFGTLKGHFSLVR
ncbi:T9SS type B sorting domain-containing protein [Zunongwangia sp. F363]|uniref:T9SS type B sorting domain-containing protein n=1 Tax=Autumnicola tepida TaxID=3075595 RepID=A0ABU3C5Z3_9FLAO|nr:T9SS type B sorting domain-containing protein [Zunongwangia sp. F363]MDT0641751.1 T9SS type B sorting domain-containing protein [Zunongwangia sp. F363]